jgi:hypothetical protein
MIPPEVIETAADYMDDFCAICMAPIDQPCNPGCQKQYFDVGELQAMFELTLVNDRVGGVNAGIDGP